MHISPTIIFRKAVAGLLLALLVFVYAEKSFHIHEKADSNTEQKGIALTSNSTGCSICDFTISKDAELPEPTVTAIPFLFFHKEYIPVLIAYHSQSGNITADRGPPSF